MGYNGLHQHGPPFNQHKAVPKLAPTQIGAYLCEETMKRGYLAYLGMVLAVAGSPECGFFQRQEAEPPFGQPPCGKRPCHTNQGRFSVP